MRTAIGARRTVATRGGGKRTLAGTCMQAHLNICFCMHRLTGTDRTSDRGDVVGPAGRPPRPRGRTMNRSFEPAEIAYLTEESRLARVATVGSDGVPHVVPTGFSFLAETGHFRISGMDFANTKKFRDVARTGTAALVVDDVLPPWQPRGIEVRGPAEAIDDGDQPHLLLQPRRIVSWGLLSDELGARHARSVQPNDGR